MNYEVRALTDQDELIVWQMLVYAAQEPSLQAVQAQSCLTHYAADWGRTGDSEVINRTGGTSFNMICKFNN